MVPGLPLQAAKVPPALLLPFIDLPVSEVLGFPPLTAFLGGPQNQCSPSLPTLHSLHVAPGRAWRAQPRKPNPPYRGDLHPPAPHHWLWEQPSPGPTKNTSWGKPIVPRKVHLQLGFGVLPDPNIMLPSPYRKKKQGLPNIFCVSSKYSSPLQKKPPRIFGVSSHSVLIYGIQVGAENTEGGIRMWWPTFLILFLLLLLLLLYPSSSSCLSSIPPAAHKELSGEEGLEGTRWERAGSP